MVKSNEVLLPVRLGVWPVLRRRPLGGRLLWLLTVHVSAAMWCLACVTLAFGLPLSVWLPLAALLFNLAAAPC